MLLQLSGLAAGYGAKTVISDVSFALEPGQILAFHRSQRCRQDHHAEDRNGPSLPLVPAK